MRCLTPKRKCHALPAGVAYLVDMPKGYAEGPAAEEAEWRRDELARDVAADDGPDEGLAVYGSTADEPQRHLIGWVPDVDPDELFASGTAWGITLVRRPRSV